MTTTTDHVTTSSLAARIADQLAVPEDVQHRHRPPVWWRQSLANGALGVALLHVEAARTDRAPWSRAHAWLRYAAAGPIDNGPGSHLHYGAPALAYVLHHASTDTARYARALATLDNHIATATVTRLDAAHRRIDAGTAPALAEFDAIRGLTGLGAYWLRRDPHGRHIQSILEYLVRLTEPRGAVPGTNQKWELELPGWWTHLAPNGRPSPAFHGGHANNGLSHGIAGPLALLALAARAGMCAPRHTAAIRRILDWLDAHQLSNTNQTSWPYWVVADDLPQMRSTAQDRRSTGDRRDVRPGRPSWCYGASGIARAQQLAGIALGDTARTRAAEAALHDAVTSSDLAAELDDPALCHGLAGVLQITRRAAADSHDQRLATHVPSLRDLAGNDLRPGNAAQPLRAPGLLDGAAGIALALDSAPLPLHAPEWDTCLLIN